jgi:hypothetical protein
MSASLKTRVNSIAEGLNADDRIQDKDITEIKYQVSESGTVTEVNIVLTVGGPYIEVECLRGVVSGQWSGETFRRGIESEEVHDYGEMLADRMEKRID